VGKELHYFLNTRILISSLFHRSCERKVEPSQMEYLKYDSYYCSCIAQPFWDDSWFTHYDGCEQYTDLNSHRQTAFVLSWCFCNARSPRLCGVSMVYLLVWH